MPLYFRGIRAEHEAVRSRAALFDVSHMGKVLLHGPEITKELQRLTPSQLPAEEGRCRYTFLLDEGGRILDDLILCRLPGPSYLGIPNAGALIHVLNWLREHLGDNAVQDLTRDLVILALQGPEAATFLQPLSTFPLDDLRFFRGAVTELPKDIPVEAEGWAALDSLLGIGSSARSYYLTRTGYTGEDGFEIHAPNPLGEAFWAELVRGAGVPPAGLGARDTLRLEKGYLLSGQDFDGRQTPLEVGYERLIDWQHEFVGRDALGAKKAEGGFRRLRGVKLTEPGVPRPGSRVWQGERDVGSLTSATFSPTLGVGIGLGYVDPGASEVGMRVTIDARARRLKGEVVRLPFL